MDINKDIILTSTDQVEGIQDDQFYRIQDEFDQIRTSTGMYISKIGNDGAIHLEKEIFNNALDECNNDNPFWKNHKKDVIVKFYESERRFITGDSGRGMPLDIMVDAVMHKHTSTKTIGISTIRNKKQTGLNGVGLTVTAALTDYMAITSYRGEYSKQIELFDGVLKEHPKVRGNSFQNGTFVEIIPSEKYLGPLNITNEMVEDYLRNMSYILAPDITVTFMAEKDPKAANKKKPDMYKRIYTSQGLGAACKYMSSSLEFNPIDIKYVSDEFDLSISFSYDRTFDEPMIASYCNNIITTEGGCHEIAAIRAICDFFSKEARRQDPNSKYEVGFDDCKKGLVIGINLEHIEPKFEGQHKTKVSNKSVEIDGKRGLYEALYKVMNNNPIILKKVINYLRQIAQARHESCKIKGVAVKRNTTFLEDAKISKYFTVSNRNSTGYKELYLAEGDSAAGGILNSRNPNFQAVYTVQGVTDNVHDLSLTQLLQKSMFKELITILGTGIGKDFDINKLRYDKIIICTDSDVDGMNITSLLLCFFLIFMPELIYSGKIYKAMPPLYLMDVKSLRKFYKGREWLYDKQEYYNMINTIIADNMEVAFEVSPVSKGSKQPTVRALSKKELIEWLNINAEYKLELDNLGKKSACDIRVLEAVCYLKKICKNDFEFKNAIEKLYPEMVYDISNYSLIGAWEGEYFSLICDTLFDKCATRFLREMKRNEYLYLWYRNKNNHEDNFTRVSIGEFLEMTEMIFPVKIEQRFKGLGEAEAQLLFRTTTNPKLRKLLRIDIKNMDEALETFELLHGKSTSLREARRDLLDNFHLSYANIDN